MCTQPCQLSCDLLLCSVVYGALLWAEWKRWGTCRDLYECVCPIWVCRSVIRDGHQRSCLSACGLVFVSPASSASQVPLDLRWRGPVAPGSDGCCPVCQPRAWRVEFCLVVYFMPFNNLSLCPYQQFFFFIMRLSVEFPKDTRWSLYSRKNSGYSVNIGWVTQEISQFLKWTSYWLETKWYKNNKVCYIWDCKNKSEESYFHEHKLDIQSEKSH